MNVEHGWAAETLELIRRLEQDKRAKAEQRVAAAQRTLDIVNQQIGALYTALEVYRAEYGLPKVAVEDADPAAFAEYQGKSPKEMLAHWAETHDGLVVMRDASKFLAAAGLFRDDTQANGTLYPTVTRSDDYEKVGRGVYRRRERPAAVPSAPETDDNLSPPVDSGEAEERRPAWIYDSIFASGKDVDGEDQAAADETSEETVEGRLRVLTF